MPRRSRAALLATCTLALLGGAATPARAASVVDAPIRTVRAGEGTMAYRSVGHGGRPLVLVTGLGVSMDAWPPAFVDRLGRHRRVIVFDNPGASRSTPAPKGKLTVPRMAHDTATLIRALGLGRPDVLGWSLGGMVAQALAVDDPRRVHRLVLAASAPGDGTATDPEGPPRDLAAGLFPPGQQAANTAYLRSLERYPAVTTPSYAVIADQGEALARWMAGEHAAGHAVRSLRLPVLVAGGAEDTILPAANERRLHELLRGSALTIYPRAAHGFLIQEATAFAGRVDRFLR